jgi:2-keto-4-pentenoate hydratase/2-oxohepta-3-ene-1,7-dioic acid hydratase in catechol pathway
MNARQKSLAYFWSVHQMKYCRFASADGPQFGLIETVAGVQQITQTTTGDLLPDFSKAKKSSAQPLSSAKLLYPVEPSKIVCVGRNYSEHAKSLRLSSRW